MRTLHKKGRLITAVTALSLAIMPFSAPLSSAFAAPKTDLVLAVHGEPSDGFDPALGWANKDIRCPGLYDNPTVKAHFAQGLASATLDELLPEWKKAAWDGETGYGMKGDAAWAWLVNIDHVYLVSKCLDVGSRQIEPHGHGFPITHNLEDWRWTCD